MKDNKKINTVYGFAAPFVKEEGCVSVREKEKSTFPKKVIRKWGEQLRKEIDKKVIRDVNKLYSAKATLEKKKPNLKRFSDEYVPGLFKLSTEERKQFND